MESRELVENWRTVLGCVIGASVGAMGFYLYTAGAFVPVLISEAGYTKEQLSIASLIVAGTTAVGAPIAGILIDRFGALKIVGTAVIGEALALGLLGLSPATFPIFAACLILFAGIGTGMAPPSFARMITSRFDRRRGIALGLSISGLGVMAIILPIIATSLIGHIGWRSSYLAAAVMILLLGGTSVLLIRSEGKIKPNPMRQSKVALSQVTGFRRPLFWFMLASFVVAVLFSNGYLLHLIVLLRERGFASENAAQIQATVGLSMLLGRIFSGVALDRLPPSLVAGATFALCALGCALLLRPETGVIVFGAFAIGFAIGAELDLMAYFVSRYFGLAQFGRLYGFAYGCMVASVGISPVLIGYLEKTGGYPLALSVSAVGVGVGSVMLFFLPDPRRQPGTVVSEAVSH